MTKVAILGDIHGNTRYLEYAIQQAKLHGAEMMIQVGDFGLGFEDDTLIEAGRLAMDNKLPLWIMRGNHDNPKVFNQHITGQHLHIIPDGFMATIGKKRVAFLGGAVSIDRDSRDPYISWWPDERINASIVKVWWYDEAKADVLISHEAPLLPDNLPGFKLPPDIKKDCDEDRHLVHMAAEALEPDQIIHGHYHMRYDREIHLHSKKALIRGLSCDGNPLIESMIIQDW